MIEYGTAEQAENPLDLMVVGENKFVAEADSAMRMQRDNPNTVLIDKDYIDGKRTSDGRIQFEH